MPAKPQAWLRALNRLVFCASKSTWMRAQQSRRWALWDIPTRIGRCNTPFYGVHAARRSLHSVVSSECLAHSVYIGDHAKCFRLRSIDFPSNKKNSTKRWIVSCWSWLWLRYLYERRPWWHSLHDPLTVYSVQPRVNRLGVHNKLCIITAIYHTWMTKWFPTVSASLGAS